MKFYEITDNESKITILKTYTKETAQYLVSEFKRMGKNVSMAESEL